MSALGFSTAGLMLIIHAGAGQCKTHCLTAVDCQQTKAQVKVQGLKDWIAEDVSFAPAWTLESM